MSTDETLHEPADAVLLNPSTGTFHERLGGTLTECGVPHCKTLKVESRAAMTSDPEKTPCRSCYGDPIATLSDTCPALTKNDREDFKVFSADSLNGFGAGRPCGICYDDDEHPSGTVLRLRNGGAKSLHRVPEEWEIETGNATGGAGP